MMDEFPPFAVRPGRLRWRIVRVADDGVERSIHPRAGWFWSRLTAVRLAMILQEAYLRGVEFGFAQATGLSLPRSGPPPAAAANDGADPET